MRYRVEQRIQTLAHNAVMKDGRMEAAFSVGPISVRHAIPRDGRGPSRCDAPQLRMVRALFANCSPRNFGGARESERILATLLFADIVGSTDHAKRLGDARWRKLLDEHRAVVRREIIRFGGTEVETAGDGFFVRFESPAHAIDCARAICAAVKHLGIEVRVGIHTGECELQGRGLTGIAVHIAARIESVADPGEILVSSTVRDIAAGSGLHFKDRGMHTLKGLPETWRLYSLTE